MTLLSPGVNCLSLQVGKGSEEDARPFLQWNIPSQKVHGVNCLAVSTAPGSDGQWEFVEYICENCKHCFVCFIGFSC